jgi:hypothetical protein
VSTTPDQREHRSLRGTVAAISTLAGLAAGQDVRRIRAVSVAGDTVVIDVGNAGDANDAQALAYQLGLPVTPTRTTRRDSGHQHEWIGRSADLDLHVIGWGFLADQVPDRLVADVLAAPVPVAYTVPAADYRSTEDVADITPADTAGL